MFNDVALKLCLCRAGAKKVYACEWNPNAIVALRHNLQVNAVEDRCIVIEGDNRLIAPQACCLVLCLVFCLQILYVILYVRRLEVLSQTLNSLENMLPSLFFVKESCNRIRSAKTRVISKS